MPPFVQWILDSPLSSVIAIEVDYDAGALSVLLAAPPTTFLGQLPEAPPGQTVSTQFQAQQLDFSAGPVKTHRCHTLYFGPSGVGVPGSRGRNARIKAAAMTSWGGRGGPATPSAIARKFMTILCQDEAVNDILEQERQTEPGGNFATQDIENSMRPVVVVDSSSKPAKARRRASAADALDDDDEDVVIPKKRKSYKPRANPGQQQSKNALDPLGAHNFMLGENGFQQDQAGHQLQQNNFNLQDGNQEPSVIPAHTFSMVQN
ncbi:hypothetical protein CEUSTIGMA_g544.t1 [Chlamydomonas eustigma]|uniref:Uncharacterized protein n=1 Tax=Chlamydomonas eustigma TaxID=1157962 RepID=A0A250WQL6_9CHLO|nr:hypothetical protein CEUSTIGMA_g544.t1 [Chlamydomonas eustigma]|eukprot:GAX73091.1 hypothetical protein CEUSTIGMA_g544.t1 [Chlamydomonas eustigma]